MNPNFEKVAVYRTLKHDPRVQNLLKELGQSSGRQKLNGRWVTNAGADEANLHNYRRYMGENSPMWLRNNNYGAYREDFNIIDKHYYGAMPSYKPGESETQRFKRWQNDLDFGHFLNKRVNKDLDNYNNSLRMHIDPDIGPYKIKGVTHRPPAYDPDSFRDADLDRARFTPKGIAREQKRLKDIEWEKGKAERAARDRESYASHRKQQELEAKKRKEAYENSLWGRFNRRASENIVDKMMNIYMK